MPTFQSLDELIANKAEEFADQIKAAAAMADKEEEIRIEAEKQLAFIQKEAGIKLEGKHEFTVASGRVDSVYDRVIIEYKNPSSPAARIGPKADSPGTKKVVEQIKKRFYDLRQEHGQALNSLFGVGLDGNHFVFVRYRDDKWQVQDPVEVNKHSAQRFLWALFNLGWKGKAFSPEYLAGDFGSEAKLAQDGIRILYEAVLSSTHPKTQTFFQQWKILYSEVCGYDVDNPSDKMKELAEFYAIPVKGLQPAELLFALHTYYAIFMKLLAAEIISFFRQLPSPLQKMIQAPTSNKLRSEAEDLEAGSIFRHLNITNFLEGDIFAWYVSAWSEPVETLIRGMVGRLDDYNPGTLSEDPSGTRDLLKKLYHELFPKSVRHDLGEYYTPDWLADHVLDDLKYSGEPDKRLLDPACGSGTFLVMAINRIRRWYEEHREDCHFDEGDLGRKILTNVVGFDLNPIAVMAARTNYLIAIRDLIPRLDKVEIPVYLCDSIVTPTEYGDLFAGAEKTAKVPCSACKPPHLLVPKEIAASSDLVAKYADALQHCIEVGLAPDDFIQHCVDESIPVTESNLHRVLYQELLTLQAANKNGVWARIIKNAFAPLFAGRFDYVAGNPPWVNWEHLPADYRKLSAGIWQKYKLQGPVPIKKRQQSDQAKTDVSILMTYVSVDKYLIVANLAVSLAARLHFANSQANDLSFQTVLRTKGRQSDLVETGTAFFRKQSPEQFSLYSRYLGVKTAYAIDYWINKSDPSRLKNEIDRLTHEADTTKGAVASLMLSARQATPQPSPTLWATPLRVSAKLPNDSVLLEYFVFRPYDAAATEGNGRYVWRSPRYGAYIIDSTHKLHVLDLGDANEIDGLVDRFRTTLGQPGPMIAVERLGRTLGDKVWTPVSQYFRGKHDVFVAPDGGLNLVPFGALVGPDHMFLIHNITFHYLSSGRDLLNLDNHEEPRQPPFLAASPCFDGSSKCGAQQDIANESQKKACESLTPARETNGHATRRTRSFDPVTDIFDADDISESRREACEISNLFSSATFVQGAQVTEQTVKELHGPAILHLATHAYYIRSKTGEVDQDLLSDETLELFRMRVESFKYPDTWHPGRPGKRFGPFLEDLTLELDPFVRSGLALSGANEHTSSGGEDGILTALETSALDLIGTELVVLSACDTGLGDVVSRGGLTGLRRSISIAGAQSQVISLWSVNDSATRMLMIEYYQRLLRGEGRADALRHAQLGLLKAPDGAIRHPYYWAGFIESGAWGPLSATTLQWRRQTPSISSK